MSEHEQMMNMMADLIQATAANGEAITRLAEALAGIRSKTVAAQAETEKVIAKAKTEPAAPANPPAAPPPAALPVQAALDYKADVAPTMAKLLATKGAPAVVALLATFGVKKGVDLPADKLADALAAATSALGA